MTRRGWALALAMTLAALTGCDDDDTSADAGADVGAVPDGGDPCVGRPDLTPCDDGQSHTFDACIGGVCVGRTCSGSITRCTSARLTVDGCEAIPSNEGAPCDDGDDFTIRDECEVGVCTGTPCACPPGYPCCDDLCGFVAPLGRICEWSSTVTCEGSCGGTATATTRLRYCTGDSPDCTGAEMVDVQGGACGTGNRCVPGTLASQDDERFGCHPGPLCN